MELNSINTLSESEALNAFRKCCGCERWAKEMAAARPYNSSAQLTEQSNHAFENLSRDDWMEAFAAHPKIGDVNSLKAKYGDTKDWANNEQSGARGISDELANELAAANEEYLTKFGYIFIVCATGKSAAEMLDLLKSRLPNTAHNELPIAAREQKKITQLRLEKL